MDNQDEQSGTSQQGNLNTGNQMLRELLTSNPSKLFPNRLSAASSRLSRFRPISFEGFQSMRNNNVTQPTSVYASNNQKFFEAMQGCSRTTMHPGLYNRKRDQSVIRFNHGELLSYLEPKPKRMRFDPDMPYGTIRFPFQGDTKKILPMGSLGERKGGPASTCTVTSFTAAAPATSVPSTVFKIPLFTSDGRPTAGILNSPDVIMSTPQDSDATMENFPRSE